MSEHHFRYILPDGALILASASATRAALLTEAGLDFTARAMAVDEDAVKQAGLAEQIEHGDIAVTLADLKASRLAATETGYVLGCDQILSAEEAIFSKPKNRKEAENHLYQLAGQSHQLLTAAVLYWGGRRIWHHLSVSTLHMRSLSQAEISSYLDSIGKAAYSSPGCYQLEGRGIHLFTKIDGDHHDILGLPVLPLLGFLRERGLTLSAQDSSSETL